MRVDNWVVYGHLDKVALSAGRVGFSVQEVLLKIERVKLKKHDRKTKRLHGCSRLRVVVSQSRESNRLYSGAF